MIEVGTIGPSRNCFMKSNLATVEMKNMDGSTLFKLRKIGRKKEGFQIGSAVKTFGWTSSSCTTRPMSSNSSAIASRPFREFELLVTLFK